MESLVGTWQGGAGGRSSGVTAVHERRLIIKVPPRIRVDHRDLSSHLDGDPENFTNAAGPQLGAMRDGGLRGQDTNRNNPGVTLKSRHEVASSVRELGLDVEGLVDTEEEEHEYDREMLVNRHRQSGEVERWD
ncbi:uncharacterized [Tachysurus ichikawai]